MEKEVGTPSCIRECINLDCTELVSSFVAKGNVDFREFCKEWKAMHFHQIYAGQMSEIEMIQTTMEIFRFCKKMLCNEQVTMKKVGAIYLLYIIYYKQPTEYNVKIEVNLITWKHIRLFIKQFENNPEYYQVSYIFWKLISEEAFRFVFSENYYGLEFPTKRQITKSIENSSTNPLEELFHSEMLKLTHKEEGFLIGFDLLQKKYNDMKKELYQNLDDKTNCIPIDDTTILSEIEKQLISVNEYLNATSKLNEKITKESTSKNTTESDDIRVKRLKIRKKGYSKLQPSTSKAKNELETLDSSSSEDNDNNCIKNETKTSPIIRRRSKLDLMKDLLNSNNLPKNMKMELGEEQLQ